MRKLTLLLATGVALVAMASAGSALAGKPGQGTCSGGEIASGTYDGLIVTGNCTIPNGATVTVEGNVTVADGAVLYAVTMSTVNITGNVKVGKGAVFGLGCSFFVPGCEEFAGLSTYTVGGNIVANQAKTMYLDFVAIHGSVVSIGGGDPSLNFPIKDNAIDGNVIVLGWHGLWFGVIRNTVGGNVVLLGNRAADTSEEPGSDSTEVVTNNISGNLLCLFNSPAAQVGDSEGATNVVGGHKLGECAGL